MAGATHDRGLGI